MSAVRIVFETHSWSEDNDRGIATGWNQGKLSSRGRTLAKELGDRRRNDETAIERVGWFLTDLVRYASGGRVLLVGHVATYWGIVHHIDGIPVDDLVAAGFDWQLGWEFEL